MFISGKVFLSMDEKSHLREALAEARKGLSEGGIFIGSVLADSSGATVARGHNLIIAIRCLRFCA